MTQLTSAFSGSLPTPAPRPADPVTEVIPRVEDYDYDYYDDDYYKDDYEDDEPSPAVDGPLRKAVRGFGEALVTAGLVVLLFVVYEVYVTDLISAGKQSEVTSALDDDWNKGADTVEPPDPRRQQKIALIEGKPFAKMYIPVFGQDWGFSIVEGTTGKHLEVGPGHYVGTALPGENGNFSVAGHRVGKGAPFNDLDLLDSCDAIVVETQAQWFVYRTLPMRNEVAGWAQGRATDPKCAGIAPLRNTLGPSYDKTVGQEIVSPTQGEVISPVPHFQGQVPVAQQAKLLTLTTCHPRFSDRQRLVLHAVMTKTYPKRQGFLPPEMREQ